MAEMEGGSLLTTINRLTRMAPNLALPRHDLILVYTKIVTHRI